MSEAEKELNRRADFSRDKLSFLSKRLKGLDSLKDIRSLCIYVCGSYGRFDAGVHSDMDVFFMTNDYEETGAAHVSNLTKIKIGYEILKIFEELELPEPSNDGQYLEVHSLHKILGNLGGRLDDYHNFFTARMLMLLESRPVYNIENYSQIIKKLVHAYFRDYHDHEVNFRPFFLVNDVLRFWKTLCLNYEHKRNGEMDDNQRKKNHLRNFKLKFSRMLICFSFVIPISVLKPSKPDLIVELTALAPFERLGRIKGKHTDAERLFNELVESYVWFLKEVSRTDILDRIGSSDIRNQMFDKARAFGDTMYQLLDKVCPEENKRYLIM